MKIILWLGGSPQHEKLKGHNVRKVENHGIREKIDLKIKRTLGYGGVNSWLLSVPLRYETPLVFYS